MARATFIGADGAEQVIELTAGRSLMENAVAKGVAGIEAVCGGNCYCATCRVYPQGAWLGVVGPAGEYEAPLIEDAGDDPATTRCSCQIVVTEALDGIVVRLPASQS